MAVKHSQRAYYVVQNLEHEVQQAIPPKMIPRRRQPARSTRPASVVHEATQGEPSAPSSEADDGHGDVERMEIDAPTLSDTQPTEMTNPPKDMYPVPTAAVTNHPPSLTTGPKNLKFQPRSFIRRDKAERDALEKAEAERQAARHAGNYLSTRSRGVSSGRGRGGDDGKSHFRGNRYDVNHQASGPLGGGVVKENAPSASKHARSGPGRVAAKDRAVDEVDPVPGEDSSTRVNPEPTIKSKGDKGVDREVPTGSSRRNNSATASKTKVKKEAGGVSYLYDEAEWDDDPAPRVNIEHINLISDDEDEDQAQQAAKGKQRERMPRISAWQLRPVRLQREEHVERHVGINTDASSLTSAELRKRAKERQNADGPLFLPKENAMDVIDNPRGKGRKGRDVEFMSGRRKWKGVWQAEENDDVKVKEEPIEGSVISVDDEHLEEQRRNTDAMVADEQQATAGARAQTTSDEEILPDSAVDAIQGKDLEGQKDEALLLPAHRRLKIRGYRDMKSILLADEEESEGHEDADFADIVTLWKSFHEDDEEATRSAAEISIKAADDSQDRKPLNLMGNAYREEKAYVIQLPPIIPSLRDRSKNISKIKIEDRKRAKTPIPEYTANPFSTQIQPDPDIKDDPDPVSKETTIANAYTVTTLQPPPGCTGTISMYDSGHIIADWGGTTLEISRESHEAESAQEVLVTEYESTMTKVEDLDRWEEVVKVGGEVREAWAVGKVEGSFVGMPSWTTLLD
ncbi:MAG: hypothetical protein Q9217_002892 [Psora testacea]